MERRALSGRAAAGSRAQARGLLLRRGASRLVVVAAWLQVLLLVALLVLEVVAKMLRGIAASKRMRRPSFASAASPWCSRDGVNATALEGNATPRLPCRKPENSSGAGERDVLWTNAGFSAAFWGSHAEWYCSTSKTQRTALTAVIGSHHTSREPCGFSNNFRAGHLPFLGSQPRPSSSRGRLRRVLSEGSGRGEGARR